MHYRELPWIAGHIMRFVLDFYVNGKYFIVWLLTKPNYFEELRDIRGKLLNRSGIVKYREKNGRRSKCGNKNTEEMILE